MTDRLCVQAGCGRPRNSRAGYCWTHEHRSVTGRDMAAPIHGYAVKNDIRRRAPLKICLAPGCENVVVSKGRCNKHYKRWRLRGAES